MEVLKKITLFGLLFLIGFSGFSQSDETPRKTYPFTNGKLLKVGAISYLIGRIPYSSEYRLIYEQVHQPSVSSEVAVSYLALNPLFKGANNSGGQKFFMQGFRVQFAEKFYWNITSEAPKGLYSGVHFSYASGRLSSNIANIYGIYYDAKVTSINFRQGVQFQYRSNYFADFFILMGYKEILVTETDLYKPPKTRDYFEDITWSKHFNFLMGLNVGISL